MKPLNFQYYQSENKSTISPPIIILHGLFGQAKNWHNCASNLSRNFEVYVLDLPNHGDSYHTAAIDYLSLSLAVSCFMEEKDIPVASFIAHSMGGKAAMLLALNQPDIIKHLIVVDIAPVNYEHDFSVILKALDRLELSSITSRSKANELLSKSIADRAVRQFLLSNLVRQKDQYRWKFNLKAIQASINEITAFPNNYGRVYNKPCWFIAGNDSDYITTNQRAEIKSLFLKSHILKIKNAGHWVHVEQAKVFLEMVSHILST